MTARGKIVKLGRLETAFKASPIMRPEYQKLGQVAHSKYKHPASRALYDVPYARLEVRSAETPEGHLVAIVNNSAKATSAPMPWSNSNYRATDLISGEELSASDARNPQNFTPFAVRLFRLTGPQQATPTK